MPPSIQLRLPVGSLKTARSSVPRGVTLVELLVVIAIIGIIVILIVPQLRFVNEDQNVREAGRVVASRFSRASQEAVRLGSREGGGGFVIELNPNILDQDRVQYAGTVIYLLKSLPPYAGDSIGDLAQKEGDYTISIPIPLEQSSRQIVMQDDLISLNNGSTLYRIVGDPKPDNGRLLLELSRGLGIATVFPPVPGISGATEFPYRILRQPRIQESSRLELPEGYLIDLRYSGELMSYESTPSAQLPVSGNVPIRSIFHHPTAGPPVKDRSLRVFYKSDGSIDHYQHFNAPFRVPSENLYFFLSRYESSPANENIFSDPSPLDRPGNLWLVINSKTGGVTISYNAPPPVGLGFADKIQYSRGIARGGIAAAN